MRGKAVQGRPQVRRPRSRRESLERRSGDLEGDIQLMRKDCSWQASAAANRLVGQLWAELEALDKAAHEVDVTAVDRERLAELAKQLPKDVLREALG